MPTAFPVELNVSAGRCLVHLRGEQEWVAAFTYTRGAWITNIATLEQCLGIAEKNTFIL